MCRTLRFLSLLVATMLVPLAGHAQLYSGGTDPGSTKWSSICTESYRIIYPRGLDSLARVYAVCLETVKGPVSGSVGFTPNQFYRKPLPVVLHTQTAYANGMVAWAPRRMELYTVPEAYSPEAISWVAELALHESRHAAQMQLGRADCFKWANVLLGEMTPGALCAVYGGPVFLEGDAVVAETALSSSGRGRTADFTEYFRASFAEGQTRNYWKWRFGSLKHYTPDYYRIGYLTNAGFRTFFDAPDFTSRFYDRVIEHHGWAPSNLKNSVREITGMKFNDAWAALADSLGHMWEDEAAARAPFTGSDRLTEEGRYFTEYESPFFLNGRMHAVRSGIARVPMIVSIDADGNARNAVRIGETSSPVKASSDGKLYWSEYRSDPRWELKSSSVLMCSDGKARKALVKGRKLYNPAPSADGKLLSATEYPQEGGSALVIFDAAGGEELQSIAAPEGWQILESAWTEDNTLYFSALTPSGIGLWKADGMVGLLDPQPVKIKQLSARGSLLYFVSDKGGSDEIYSLDPADCSLRQLTSSRVGASDYCFSADTLYYAQLTTSGRMLYSTPVTEGSPASWGEVHSYPMAEKLSAEDPGNGMWLKNFTFVSEPQDYSKFRHLVHLHSWAPVFVDADAISTISMESIASSAGIGATAFFQNELGTSDGTAGINLLNSAFQWEPSLNVKFNYRGWYPVFELDASITDAEASSLVCTYSQEKNTMTIDRPGNGVPEASAMLRTYLPLSVSSGGVTRGLIPQLSFGFNTDNLDRIVYELKDRTETVSVGGFRPVHKLNASLRGYVIGSTPASCVLPKLGIGLEAGYCGRPWMADLYCSDLYLSTYGYLPGLWPTHGVRLGAKMQYRLSDGMLCEPCIEMRPRGFVASEVSYRLASYQLCRMYSLEYVMPFASLDWNISGGFMYIRNLELRPFADFLKYSKKSGAGENLFSAGACFNVVLGSLFWIPYLTRIGVQASFNGGSGFAGLQDGEIPVDRFKLGLNLTIDM